MYEDTICAMATAPGQAGVSIVRVSGPAALSIGKKVFFPIKNQKIRNPRHMYLGEVRLNEEPLDHALGVYFGAPSSYTGEDVFEIHCHGGQVVVQMIMAALLKSGARPAEPGEFTKRAFLNGKMDLSMAEAVADQIGALSVSGAKQAAKQASGALYEKIAALQDTLTNVLAELEAGIEYPEEDLEEGITKDTLPWLKEALADIQKLESSFRQGKIIKEGLRIALVGKPNVGKSSLLNAIFGEDRAIVSDIPGTTRDVVSEYYTIHGVPLLFLDTAGMRKTEDVIEKIGVDRTLKVIEDASLVLLVLDGAKPLQQEDMDAFAYAKKQGKPIFLLRNKADLTIGLSQREIEQAFGQSAMDISALYNQGIETLLEALYQIAVGDVALQEGLMITNERHAYALQEAAVGLKDAIVALETQVDMDCVSIDITNAWRALGEITGQTVSDQIIARIFEKFCLGK